MQIVLSGLLGVFLTVIVSSFYNIWKFHRDERLKTIDEICNCLIKCADSASEYWSKKYEIKEDQKIVEAKIQALQNIVDGYYNDIRCYFYDAAASKIDNSLSNFIDSATGGDFTNSKREIDLRRIETCQLYAVESIILLRKYHRESMPFYRFFANYHNNKNMKLDLPPNFQ